MEARVIHPVEKFTTSKMFAVYLVKIKNTNTESNPTSTTKCRTGTTAARRLNRMRTPVDLGQGLLKPPYARKKVTAVEVGYEIAETCSEHATGYARCTHTRRQDRTPHLLERSTSAWALHLYQPLICLPPKYVPAYVHSGTGARGDEHCK
ncbi:hypothetical protein CBL_10988 [Carabus blaptoides fortunei]